MIIAIIGSRSLFVDKIEKYLPENITEIVSGSAKGIDTCVKLYAMKNKIKLTEFLPNYSRYRKGAPLKRNLEIIDYAEEVIAFWDGKSKGTEFVIKECKKKNKIITVYLYDEQRMNYIKV